MFPRSARVVAALFTFALLLAGTAFATDIELNNGTLYSGVTIIRQDARSIEFQVKYGTMVLPMSEIAKINHVAIRPAPVQVRSSVAPGGAVSQPALPGTRAMPGGALPTGAVAVAPPVIPGLNATPAASPGPASPPPASPTPAPPAASWTLPAWSNPSGWNLSWSDLWLPLVGVAWLASIRRVWRATRRTTGGAARLGLAMTVLLPIVGWLLYELVRIAAQGRRGAHDAADSIHEFIFLDVNHQPVMIEPGAGGSGLENAKGVLQAALFDRASDVHIEPGATEYRVRFRIDGVLNPRMSFSPEDGLRMVSALKNVAQLDISDRRKAQDGRFGGRAGGRDVDFRAATTPTVHGEKLVLRVLDQKSGVRGLADLGMTQTMMERFAEVIQLRSGMILATGPTGSGKTSSLYAALTQLDAVALNIVTIEDPVEYELAGATQIPVNVKAGITYESGLRSILRQDPDVILVGEMRDSEAAQIALRSALTGHLVFSSLHSRDAVGTIHRLEEMGIERHLLASALMVVLSQRLVRVLCPDCRRPTVTVGNELAEIGIELPSGQTIYEPGGCRRCDSSGYLGRTGMFEMLVLDEALRQEINNGTPEDEFARSARTGGYREYREDGAEKVLRGITSVEEVLKAI